MHAHLFRSKPISDRLAVVSVLPSSSAPGAYLVQIARGASKLALTDVRAFGPIAEEHVASVFEQRISDLRKEGFSRSGLGELLASLDSKSRRKRALAAKRLGWLSERAAAPVLLALAEKANEELPVLLDALGEIGDQAAIPVARKAAERKLLSRRRSGFEALLKLGDTDGLAEARTRALERIPESMRALVAGTNAQAIVEAVRAVSLKDRGLVLDTLYELETETVGAALRELCRTEMLHVPHLWRYAKSLLKRTMLRRDHELFGILAHRIERLGRSSTGEKATVKSGYDGESKTMRIFGKKTQRYVARASWRYLRSLARYRPSQYAFAAAYVLTSYTAVDLEIPKGRYGALAQAYLAMRILYGESPRYEVESRTLAHRLVKGASVSAAPGAREESFPEAWTAVPRAYLRVLARAQLADALQFALRAFRERHPGLIQKATPGDLAAMLGSAVVDVSTLALQEVTRRFDAQNPDWELVSSLLRDERENVVNVGLQFLEVTAPIWTRSAERILAFLALANPAVRAATLAHVLRELPNVARLERAALAAAVLATLKTAEPEDGAHDPEAQVARALALDIAAMVSVEELMSLFQGSLSAQGAAAAILVVHPAARERISKDQVLFMGRHDHAMQREAARALMRMRMSELALDPSPLFDWCEVSWPDTRDFAIAVLEHEIPLAALTLEAVLGFCDSNQEPLQDLGKKLLAKQIDTLDTTMLVKRLSEHPHRNVRRYALELAIRHLKPGFVPLAALESFFRSFLFDPMPERKTKNEAIAFLARRGLEDESQAELASRLLGEVVRSRTQRDIEPALVGLADIRVRYPELEMVVRLAEGPK